MPRTPSSRTLSETPWRTLSSRPIYANKWLTLREDLVALPDGRITIYGVVTAIRTKSIHVRYDVAVPPEAREATERALELHPQGCPAHQSVKDAIAITWDAAVRVGEQTITLRGGPDAADRLETSA